MATSFERKDMYSETTEVINQLGLHARPSSDLSLKAKEFNSVITIKNLSNPESKKINAKTMMKVLAASITMGSAVEISAEGEDEQQAVKELIKLFESGFSEK